MKYYIQGSPARAKEIKAAFERLGIRADGYDFSRIDVLFFTFEAKGKTYMMSSSLGTGLDNIILTHPDYKELELPKPHYDIKNFYAGMPVLVRPDNDCCWDYSVFSRNTGNEYWNFAVCNGVSFTQCIPLNEETKHLIGTTEMCDEMYINW